MKHYSPEERAAVLQKSRELLSDEPPTPPPAPAPSPPTLVEEADPVREWRDWHDARDREREAVRAQMRSEERREREGMARAQALDGAEARITGLEERMTEVERQIAELSRAIEDFSNAVTD